MRREQLAINSVSTRQADLETCLAAYQKAGFANVEFRLVRDYLEKGHSRADARRLLDDFGLSCVGGFETGLVCFGSGKERTANHDRIADNSELLAQLGASTMVVGTDGPSEDMDDPLEPLAETFARMAERIADTGIALCIEFNWSPLVKSLRTAAEVARRTGRDNVGALFDPAHYHCTPSKFEQIDAANASLIKHIHVDDMRDKPGELSNCNADRVLPGQGCLDLPALFGQIERFGYEGYFSIEMFSDELWAMVGGESGGADVSEHDRAVHRLRR